MATVINNPDTSGDSGGMGWVVGMIIAILLAFVFFVYALPAIRNSGSGTNINVPDKIDVNVNQPAQ